MQWCKSQNPLKIKVGNLSTRPVFKYSIKTGINNITATPRNMLPIVAQNENGL